MGLQYRPLERSHLFSSFVSLCGEAFIHAIQLTIWTPPIFYLVGKYLDLSGNHFRYVLCWAAGAVTFVLLYTSMAWVLVPPYDVVLQKIVPRSFQSGFEKVRGGFDDDIFMYLAIVIGAHAYHYLKRLRREERERYEYQQALAASELQALKMQLQPHFLFNALHGIATLVDSDATNARTMILKLSKLLRIVFERSSSDLVPLEYDLTFLRKYLDLEQMRFGNRLMINWLISPDTCRLLVPQMILQPLVENAIRHGVASCRESGWLQIQSKASNRDLIIQIRNNVGKKNSDGNGVGLRNVETRLKYLYGDDASFRLSFADEGSQSLL